MKPTESLKKKKRNLNANKKNVNVLIASLKSLNNKETYACFAAK